jgi:hypothetical protein
VKNKVSPDKQWADVVVGRFYQGFFYCPKTFEIAR